MCWMRHDRQRMPPLRVLAAYAAVALIWGSTWAAIKIGVTEVPPFIFAFDRAVAVAAILTLVALSLRQPFPRGTRELAVVAVVGIINTGGSWAIIFWAEQFVPSGLVAVFGASAPVWTAFLAHFLVKGDRLSALKIAGLGFGVMGIALLVGAPRASEGPTTITLIQVIVPAEAILIGALWLGETVTAQMLGGAALVAAAVALNALAGRGMPSAADRARAAAAAAAK